MIAKPFLIPDFKLLDDYICTKLLAFITQNNPGSRNLPVIGSVTRNNTSNDSICNESLGLTEQYILNLEGRYLAAFWCFECILDPAYDAARRTSLDDNRSKQRVQVNLRKAIVLIHSN